MILVSGSTGFVGRSLVERLLLDGRAVVGSVRSPTAKLPKGAESVQISGLGPNCDWSAALSGVSIVVHTAARVHVMKDTASDPLVEFQSVNVEGTRELAEQAAEAGVRRFVFLSSVKVNGEATKPGLPFRDDEPAAPEDAYGQSKWEAEQALMEVARRTGLEVVIIRPPLVYGRGVKGNFASMTRLVEKGIPLPLGAVHNKRSLVALDNLIDLIVTCIDHPAAANQVFLAGDGEDLSTTELLRDVAKAMGVQSRLIPVPAWMLMFGASLLGKKSVAQRLLGSLQVDISKAREVLGWEPPVSVEEGLRRIFND